MLLIGQLLLNFCILEFENAMGYKGNYVKVFFSFCTFNEEIIRTIDKQGKYYMHKFIKYWLMRLQVTAGSCLFSMQIQCTRLMKKEETFETLLNYFCRLPVDETREAQAKHIYHPGTTMDSGSGANVLCGK